MEGTKQIKSVDLHRACIALQSYLEENGIHGTHKKSRSMFGIDDLTALENLANTVLTEIKVDKNKIMNNITETNFWEKL